MHAACDTLAVGTPERAQDLSPRYLNQGRTSANQRHLSAPQSFWSDPCFPEIFVMIRSADCAMASVSGSHSSRRKALLHATKHRNPDAMVTSAVHET
jgi:hypothetical protein